MKRRASLLFGLGVLVSLSMSVPTYAATDNTQSIPQTQEAQQNEEGTEISSYKISEKTADGQWQLQDQNGNVVHWEAIAVGGGMVEMQKLEEFEVNICGDFFELLVMLDTERCPVETYESKITRLTGKSEFSLQSKKTGEAQMANREL